MTFDDDDACELNDWAPDLAGSRSAWRDVQRWGADGVVAIAQPDTNFTACRPQGRSSYLHVVVDPYRGTSTHLVLRVLPVELYVAIVELYQVLTKKASRPARFDFRARMTSAQTKRRVHALRAQLRASPCIGEQENRSLDLDGAERANDQISVQAGSIFVHRFERHALKIAFADSSAVDDRYGGSGTSVILEGELLKPKTNRDTVLVFMHPSGIMNLLPMPNALARAGEHVITMASRYPNNDSCLVMEKVLIDLGAVVAHAKKQLGYTRVVLIGWSGGGALSCFYQQQAELCPAERLHDTPAGDAVDLGSLQPANALVLMAAHASRARILTEWLDPAETDAGLVGSPGATEKLNPGTACGAQDRIEELDLYGESGAPRPPFSASFVARFRAAQLARNRRITAWVRRRLAAVHARTGAGQLGTGWQRERRDECFVVQCTQADPRRLDARLEPNDRDDPLTLGPKQAAESSAGALDLALAALARENHSPVGLARFCTLRSWLSQWSADESRADGPRCLSTPGVRVPVLVVENGADHLVPQSHCRALYEAVPHDDKKYVMVPHATHYYFGQREKLGDATNAVLGWLRAHSF